MKSTRLFYQMVIISCLLLSNMDIQSGQAQTGETGDSKQRDENTVLLYSFENRDRGEWIGSNHFEGFLITDEWSSAGGYSLKGILAQQSQTDWEPELTKFFRPYGIDLSRFKSISADVRHQAGNCDPGGGMSARIYLTDEDENWIGSGEPVAIGTEVRTVTMKLPDDLAGEVNPVKLHKIWRISIQFLPCPSSTGNIDIYIDNITAQRID